MVKTTTCGNSYNTLCYLVEIYWNNVIRVLMKLFANYSNIMQISLNVSFRKSFWTLLLRQILLRCYLIDCARLTNGWKFDEWYWYSSKFIETNFICNDLKLCASILAPWSTYLQFSLSLVSAILFKLRISIIVERSSLRRIL